MNLTIKEAASSIKESPHIVRNWLRDYKGLIPIEKGENGYNYFTPKGVEVLRQIKRLIRDHGYSSRQVAHFLSGGELAAAVEETATPEVAAAEIGELRDMMQQIMDRQEEQREFNRSLIEQLEQRDKLLREYMNERRQERLELKQQQEQQKRPWWAFLARK